MSSQAERDILPKTFKPIHYDLDIFNINVITNAFDGKVTIELDVLEASNSIVLHASEITFRNVEVKYSITKTESIIQVKDIVSDEKSQVTTIKLNEEIKAGPSAKVFLTIEYSAKIKNNMNGFYRSEYKDKTGKDQVLLSTQFEATEARSALPSFDEPNLKASFSLSLTIAEDFTGLSNTPVQSSKVLDDGKKKGAIEASGLKKITFQKTPVMSTYLLAWVVGKLDYVESFTDNVYNGSKLPIRVYTPEGDSKKGLFALEVASKVVDFFSKIFEIDYVLPKLDLISVPAYSHNAMENWGLITFRPTALLFDEATSDPNYKTKVAYVVAHELAHQWFGNLVTMNWWDELWLNEGFATWVGYYAIEHIHPQWRIFEEFASDSLQSALELDSLRGSHPVEVPIQSSSDIDQVFDHISYLKGGSVLNQLAETLGKGVFLKGVSIYLKKHSFGNATTYDLWNAISGVANVDVISLTDNWIRKIGFPYVSVSAKENGDVTFLQNRFISSGDVKDEENLTTWWIPLRISTGKKETDLLSDISLSSKEFTARSLAKDHEFFKINKDSIGVYRTVYDQKTLKNIINNLSNLSPTDKVGLVADATVTSTAGLTKTSQALDIISSFKGESEYVVWSQVLKSLQNIISAWSGQPAKIVDGLNKFAKEILGPAAVSLGFEKSPSDDHLVSQLRIKLLSAAVSVSIPEIIEQAKSIYFNRESAEGIDPSLRIVIYSAVVSGLNATEQDFDEIFNITKTSKALDAKEIVLTALGKVTNPKLIEKSLRLILDPEVPIMDVQFVAVSLANNPKARWELWKYLKNNYGAIHERLNVNAVVFDRFIKFTLGHFSTSEAYEEINEFFKGKDIYGFERSLNQVLDSIETNAGWVKRDNENVEQWLLDHNYI